MSATTIECGTHVTWEGKSGQVDLVVSSGVVPGVEGEHAGTADAPVARVVIGEEKVAVPVADLTVAEPEPEHKGEAAALVGLLAEHARKAEGKGAAATLSPESVLTAFERGLHEWPGEDVTTLTPEEWAVGRVAHLSKAALAPDVAQAEGLNDADLLDPSNPAFAAPATPDGADGGAPAAPAADQALGTGLSGAEPGEADTVPSKPVIPKPDLQTFDFTGSEDPNDPDDDLPVGPPNGQMDTGGDQGPDGNPDASNDGTTVSAAQMQEMLGEWDDAATPTDGEPVSET